MDLGGQILDARLRSRIFFFFFCYVHLTFERRLTTKKYYYLSFSFALWTILRARRHWPTRCRESCRNKPIIEIRDIDISVRVFVCTGQRDTRATLPAWTGYPQLCTPNVELGLVDCGTGMQGFHLTAELQSN